jgi:hypothetical protein
MQLFVPMSEGCSKWITFTPWVVGDISIAGFVRGLFCVKPVFSFVCWLKVLNAIVSFLSVFVVKRTRRPRSIYVQPRKAMCAVIHPQQLNAVVPGVFMDVPCLLPGKVFTTSA